MQIRPGHVFWLFGLSGAGKTTLATALQQELREKSGVAALMLDGDGLRQGLCQGLGFEAADRTENLRRAAEVARLAVDSGLVVIAAFITPMAEQRAMVRRIVGAEHLSLVLVDAPLAVCQQRDVKGLYRDAAAGKLKLMTGVASAFETAGDVALHLDTEHETPVESEARLGEYARARLA
ncbi:MAG: adenylyl-sulfate kinase [Opitutales bacterium]